MDLIDEGKKWEWDIIKIIFKLMTSVFSSFVLHVLMIYINDIIICVFGSKFLARSGWVTSPEARSDFSSLEFKFPARSRPGPEYRSMLTPDPDYMLNRIGSRGGAITLTKDNYGFCFNTKRMPWCHVTLDSENYGLNPNEHFTDKM